MLSKKSFADVKLIAVRMNTLPLQASLKDTISVQRSLENKLSTSQNTDSSHEFKIRELEGRMRALEKENEMLRQKVARYAL